MTALSVQCTEPKRAAKPATLQLNARGSWRNVCEFDVADPAATNLIMEAAATISTYAIDKPTARIVKLEAGCPIPLLRWTSDGGWRPWREAR